MDRRTFLRGLVATAAGVLIPASVAAEPERRVWALDRTMVRPVGAINVLDYGVQRDWTMLRLTEAGTEETVLVPLRVPGVIHIPPGQWWDPLESTCRHASLSIL